MTIYIAKDWYSTIVFTTKPKLMLSGIGQKEWYGHREHFLEACIPEDIKKSIKMNECIECELTLDFKKK